MPLQFAALEGRPATIGAFARLTGGPTPGSK